MLHRRASKNYMSGRLKTLFISFVLALLMPACSNEAFKPSVAYDSYGLISGLDLALCACCGGYVIRIDDEVYRVDSILPPHDKKLENAAFPLAVNLDWHLNAASACSNRIIIDALEIAT
jgi:hypothetical protein